MNDSDKCAGVGCSIREHCLRFTRPAMDGQQWLEPLWWHYNAPDGIKTILRCEDHQPLPVEPHGGAQEEVDGS